MASKPGPPMTLANMRSNGVRMVTATCANCGRSAAVDVDALPETLTVAARSGSSRGAWGNRSSSMTRRKHRERDRRDGNADHVRDRVAKPSGAFQ